MAKIIDTSRSLTRVGDTSTALRRIDTKKVAVALGARPVRRLSRGAKGRMSFLALAEVIGRQLASTGGRPALESAEPRQKIPPHKGDWQRLKRIAAQLKHQGVRCTPGQVASVLLHNQIERLEADGGRGRERVMAAGPPIATAPSRRSRGPLCPPRIRTPP